jgi:Zn-dependent metalloprotease
MNLNHLLLAAALLWVAPAIHEALAHSERLKPAIRAVERLQTESAGTLAIEWNAAAATPGLLTGFLTKPSRHSPEWISFEFLRGARALYGLKRVEESMKITRVERELPDRTKVFLQRQLYGKPVCGNELAIEMDKSGVVRRVEGTIHADLEKRRLNRPMYPAISGREAASVASRHMNPLQPAQAADVQACYLPEREGVPLIYVVTFDPEQTGSPPLPIKVHSLTGRVIP